MANPVMEWKQVSPWVVAAKEVEPVKVGVSLIRSVMLDRSLPTTVVAAKDVEPVKVGVSLIRS